LLIDRVGRQPRYKINGNLNFQAVGYLDEST